MTFLTLDITYIIIIPQGVNTIISTVKEECRVLGRHRTRVIYLDHVENIREGFSEDRASEKRAKGQIGIIEENLGGI